MLINNEELKRLKRGEIVNVNGKVYAICRKCKSIVRLNKFLFGSAHPCS